MAGDRWLRRVGSRLAIPMCITALVVVVTPVRSWASSAGDSSVALVAVEDLPDGWAEYVPPPTATPIRTRRGTCGRKAARVVPSESEVTAAFAFDDLTGPVFGERIETFAPGAARRRMAQWSTPQLPCAWKDAGFDWRAEPLPAPRLGGASAAYLLRKAPGSFAYNYEYAVRRGNDVLTFVLNSDDPSAALAESLVRAALARYDATVLGAPSA